MLPAYKIAWRKTCRQATVKHRKQTLWTCLATKLPAHCEWLFVKGKQQFLGFSHHGAFFTGAHFQYNLRTVRYPYPAERETFPVPLDKGNAGSGNEIARGPE